MGHDATPIFPFPGHPVSGMHAPHNRHSRVNEAGEVAVGHDGAGQLVALLDLALLGLCAKDGVQAVKGGASPDAEAAHVATRGQLHGGEGVGSAHARMRAASRQGGKGCV